MLAISMDSRRVDLMRFSLVVISGLCDEYRVGSHHLSLDEFLDIFGLLFHDVLNHRNGIKAFVRGFHQSLMDDVIGVIQFGQEWVFADVFF